MGRQKGLKPRTDEELRLLSEHVLWHVRMLFGLSERIEATALRIGPSFSAPEDAALLESFAVHARALIEFFWKEDGAWHEDGRAVQFFDEGEWARIRRPMESTLDTVFDRASWGIVHISFKRVFGPAEAREWRFAQIAASIGRCLRLFVQHVPDTRVSPEVKSQVVVYRYENGRWSRCGASGPGRRFVAFRDGGSGRTRSGRPRRSYGL